MSPKAKPDATDAEISQSLAETAATLLARLTPREEAVLRARFGIEPKEGDAELEEVGQDFETTRARIREIEAKALAKLRKKE